jgi:uncharacterized phage protein gp47/JayE
MTFGLTPEGFNPKTLEEQKLELEQALQAKFGVDIDLRSQSVFGQLVGISSEIWAEMWAWLNDIYLNAYPDSASGISLDRVCALTNVVRQPATASTVDAIAYGIQGTFLEAGQEALDSLANKTFVSVDDVTIDKASARDVSVRASSAVTGTYTVTINGTAYSFVATGTPTLNSIALGLQTAITSTAVTKQVTGDVLRLYNLNTNFAVDITGNMTFQEIGTSMALEALEKGSLNVPIEAIDTIQTPVSGWARINNLKVGIEGQDLETDAELRLRRTASLEKSIIKAILAVENVKQAIVFENNTDVIDADGTPAHYIWAVVNGGASADIVKAIVLNNSAGIGTRGLQSGTYTSPYTGLSLIARFDRPTEVNPLIVLTYTTTEDNTFPADGVAQIKQALVAYGATFQMGQDLVHSRVFSAINVVQGFQVDTLTINASTSTLNVAKNQLVVIREVDITVTETP